MSISFPHSRRMWFLFLSLNLTACTLTPGSHLTGIHSGEKTEQIQQDLDNVNIQLIDSTLISEQIKAKQPQTDPSKVSGIDTSDYQYRIGVGDVLTIGLWDHPELTIPAAVQRTAEFDGFRVQADGTITYAYAPNMKAAGKTVQELHRDLVRQLGRVIENPQVDVKVVGFRSQKAYVTGEVAKPGVYPISEIPLTLIDALNQAGGLTGLADWTRVTFTRDGKTERIHLDDFYTHGDISQNRLLKHGDIIHVSRNDAQKVYVLGDVKDAGSLIVDRYGMTLARAISDAGGINENTADANGIFVLRKREDTRESGIIADVYQLHAKNIAALVLAEQFELRPRDIVYVTSAPLARWNRVINLLLPTVTMIDGASDISANGF